MPVGTSYQYKGTNGCKEVGEAYYNVISDIIMWGRDKGLDDPKAQLNKVIEEIGEIAHEITRNNYDLESLEQPDELYDAIGDSLVTIYILSDILNIDPLAAMEVAYDAIKDRRGKTIDGTFVKEEQAEVQ